MSKTIYERGRSSEWSLTAVAVEDEEVGEVGGVPELRDYLDGDLDLHDLLLDECD